MKTIKCSIKNVRTKSLRYPSFTIQTSILSFRYSCRGLSSDISPDMSMRVSGGHLDRSRPVRLVDLNCDMAGERREAQY